MQAIRDTYRYVKTGLSKWMQIVLILFFLLAIFGDFIANEKPLYCHISGKAYMPVLRSYLVSAGLAEWPEALLGIDWINAPYDRVLRAPVPYSASYLDIAHANYVGPFDRQEVDRWYFRHWLGTDRVGRDVLAGLIHGCRITLFIGICSMLLAALLGIPVGAFIAYFGDTRLRTDLLSLFLAAVVFLAGVFMGIQAAGRMVRADAQVSWTAVAFLCLGVAATVFSILILREGQRFFSRLNTFSIPVDFGVMRVIEIFKSLPAFFILFAILGIIENASMAYVILVIGLLRWPAIARYVRAETLRIRALTYIQSARMAGLSHFQIIRKHVLPNALGPALIYLAFGVATAVLLESGLSFLGIGLGIDAVSWGKLLNAARFQISAWWLAIFPGLSIFITIVIFIRIGEVLGLHYQHGES